MSNPCAPSWSKLPRSSRPTQISLRKTFLSGRKQNFSGSSTAAVESLSRLASSYQRGEIIRSGVQIPIVGPTNAGKSSLFNAILAEERAIVTEIPGTTRDTIAEKIEIDGLAVRFIDTAGLRESQDTIETAGIERSRREIAASNLIICVFDITTTGADAVTSAMTEYQGQGRHAGS